MMRIHTATQSPPQCYQIHPDGHLVGCSCEVELRQQNLTINESELRMIVQNAHVWLPSTTSNTATPTIRYFFSISRGQLRTITDPPML
jgi:hypothetical protein